MVQLVATIVLYKQTPVESVALRTLTAELRERADLVRLLIYDNSPAAQDNLLSRDITGGITTQYIHDQSNGGLTAAYGSALDWAVRDGVPWLMLLDQDTEVTSEYIEEALRLCGRLNTGICAMTPRLMVNGEQRSPHRLEHAQAGKPVGSAGQLETGRSSERLGAWNSGAIFRVGSLIAAGGFPSEFPLDNLDYAVFHLLQQGQRRIYVMHSQLTHQLSVADLHSLSAARLRNKLAADILLQRRLHHRSKFSLAVEFLRTGLSLLLKLPDKRMGLTCLRFSVASLLPGK